MTQKPAVPLQHFTIGSVDVTIANGSEVSVRPVRPGNPGGDGRGAAIGEGREPGRVPASGAPIAAAALAVVSLPLRVFAALLGGLPA